ncbi:CAP domain-containing protein [Olsenella sp. YH-ols2217]|uniref:CAP domain-containing protein n=1 Tax=Kribbibacterium absianum TaxID=3044210 RepID=A0ABT6ZMW9_9ACTN|nr:MULTISPECIES: CAP domain-containing protein [unclassified Olsenella]MDJ1130212.1 CAP domain-containing protein [Olsenella sp. YH-ols2217]
MRKHVSIRFLSGLWAIALAVIVAATPRIAVAEEGWIGEPGATTSLGEALATEDPAAIPAPAAIGANETVKMTGKDLYNVAQEVVALVNRERAAVGVAPLVLDAALTDTAMQRSAELWFLFSHDRPNGAGCFTAWPESHAYYGMGENIAAGYGTAQAVVKGWMESPGHRGNILNASYKSIGVGCFSWTGNPIYWVQCFSSGSSSASAATSAKTVTRSVELSYDVCGTSQGLNLNMDPGVYLSTLRIGDTFQHEYGIGTVDGLNTYARIDPSCVTWTSSNNAVATVDAKGVVTAKSPGTVKVTGTLPSGRSVSNTWTVPKPSVTYRAHAQSYGWMSWVKDGATAGTVGESKRLEAVNIRLENLPDSLSKNVRIRTHVQTYGWQDWVGPDTLAGTSGQSKRLEAVQIQLTGELEKLYDVYYRTHVQSFGWTGWAKNGASCGSEGMSKRLEGLQVKLVPKGQAAPGKTDSVYYAPVTVTYQAHAQTFGWMDWVQNGATAGTEGKAKRLEAIKVKLVNAPFSGSIQANAHVQTYGWRDWVPEGGLVGTSGRSKRLEAVQIKLTGELAKRYDVYYRVHCQTFGWTGWAQNGAKCGSAGYGKRLEGIQIKVLPKGSSAPGSTAKAFYQK